MLLNSKVYDVLKKLVQVGLPALATLYYALAQIWDLPAAENVVGTITAVTTFLGVILGLSSSAYSKSEAKYDGVINVIETEDKKLFSLELKTDPNVLDTQREAVFKISTS